MSDRMRTALTVAAFRLGLSWLVGTRWLLLTTTPGEAGSIRRTALPYRWRDGELCVRDRPGVDWAEDLRRQPVALAQAAPGPLAVAATFHDDHTVTLPPTGRPAPLPVVPDLLWVYPVAAVTAATLSTVARRHRR
jgi:hypothetical protein